MKKMVLLPYDRYERLLSETTKQQREATDNEKRSTQQEDRVISEQNKAEKVIPSKQLVEEDKLLAQFPRTLRSRARLLLNYLTPQVTWNDKSEILISGQLIPNSNIVDLIKVQLKDYRDFRPTGIEDFDKLLTDINVPLSLLTPSRREQTGRGIIPPPPGLPVKRKASTTPVRKVKWLKL